MSFYNMLFGCNSNKDVILSFLELKDCDVERFRDCGIDSDNKEIFIYARTGGGNREDYPNDILTSNPWYKYDEDDDFDSTYATYYFEFPKEIEDDILDFQNFKENGISGKLATWILNTMNRKETENDKWQKAYKLQMQIVKELQQSFDCSTAFNGHTIVPLSDRGMERLLKVTEDNDGEFTAYWSFLPYKLKLLQDESKWKSLDKGKSKVEQDQVRIGIDIIWEIDMDAWSRYEKKFEKKYPKTIEKMREKIESRNK